MINPRSLTYIHDTLFHLDRSNENFPPYTETLLLHQQIQSPRFDILLLEDSLHTAHHRYLIQTK